jgi:UDP-glucuronate decarboxylase
MQPLSHDITTICQNLTPFFSLLSGRKLVITGGQGFLGQYICTTLHILNQEYLSEPCQVIVVDNFITAGKKELPKYPHFTYIRAGVEENLYFTHPNDYVMFLAGIASPHYYIKYPLQTIEIISHGLSNYLRLAQQWGSKLLFASSSEIYGTPDTAHIPTPETYHGNVSTLSERSCYDESKRLGETLCHVYASLGVNATIIRPFNFYGPLMSPTDYRVLPNFANNILHGKTVQLYGNGQQTRTFCYITDGITGMFQTLLLGQAGEAYNIGNPEPEISMSDLLNLCQEVCLENQIIHPPLHKQIVKVPAHYPVSGDPTRRCPNIEKAIKQLHYQPQVSLRQGLTQFLTWTSQNY